MAERRDETADRDCHLLLRTGRCGPGGQAFVAGGRRGVSFVIATPEILAHGPPTAVAQTPNYNNG